MIILSLEQLKLDKNAKAARSDKGYNSDEENDSEADQEELLDQVGSLKTDVVDKQTDEHVKMAIRSAEITNRMKLSPAS